ncbi:MAG: histidine phosphatase family protein [Anaerolineales bacterium]
MTTLFLVRHGQTDWNVQGRYTGQSDIPLNALGRRQAHAAASQLADLSPSAVYTSDLQRAYETARIIAQRCTLPLYTDVRLREINQGVWEGLLLDEIKARYAAEFARRAADPVHIAPPGGERVGAVQTRVLNAVADIVAAFPAQQVVVASHGLALALIKAYYSGHSITQAWDLIPPNATVEQVEVVAPPRGDDSKQPPHSRP